jgi:hypothetical protein
MMATTERFAASCALRVANAILKVRSAEQRAPLALDLLWLGSRPAPGIASVLCF